MKMPQIFLSYSWANSAIADKIYHDLTLVGFSVIKDNHNLKYTDRLPDFMKKIRKADFALLLVCDDYIKSLNCMTEVMQLGKDDDNWNKTLPVICKGAKFYKAFDRLKYVTYWQNVTNDFEQEMKKIDIINAPDLIGELRKYKEIAQNIDSFLTNLKDRLLVTPKQLFSGFYNDLFDRMKVEPDLTRMFTLATISFIKDPTLRLEGIMEFIKREKIENATTYSIQASCYRDLNQPEKAVRFYKKSLTLDDLDGVTWNNLGQVYELAYQNYNAAKKAYKKAIARSPELDVPRLNLGVLLSTHFGDEKGAKSQYEAILKFDESNPKAHNNLGNIYKGKNYFNLKKAEQHFLIAVSQNHLNALINYANFLKLFKKDFERGNFYYKKAKEIDTENIYTDLIDKLIQSKKA